MPNQSLFVFAEGTGAREARGFRAAFAVMRARVTTIPETIPPKDSEVEALQRNVFDVVPADRSRFANALRRAFDGAMNIEDQDGW